MLAEGHFVWLTLLRTDSVVHSPSKDAPNSMVGLCVLK